MEVPPSNYEALRQYHKLAYGYLSRALEIEESEKGKYTYILLAIILIDWMENTSVGGLKPWIL